MDKRTVIYARTIGTSGELFSDLRRTMEDRGDVVAVFRDDARIETKGKHAGWRALLTHLNQVDQIVLDDPGDLPGKTVKDLLAILATLTVSGVSIVVPGLGIDTSTGSGAILDLITAYRSAKLSAAIKRGQQKARIAGKKIGRPPIPQSVRQLILTDIANGGGVRPTARKFGVSPAAVIDIRRSVAAGSDRMAA